MFSNKFGAKIIFKALIGWSGLVYFFVAKNEAWGEAIGLTLFFASGQIQNALKPPFLESVWLSNIIDADNCLEAWRITLGLASSIYYFYFALYLNNGLSIYVSTVCLSLLWESQIVDDVINMLGTWLSCEMVPSMKFCAHNFEQLKVKFQKSKSRQRNIIQDFLCVLCKLYKHLKMNCEITSKFLITKIGSEKLSRDAESKILPDDAARKSKENAGEYLSCIRKEMLKKNIRNVQVNICGGKTTNKYMVVSAQPQYCRKNALHNTKNLSKARAAKSSVF